MVVPRMFNGRCSCFHGASVRTMESCIDDRNQPVIKTSKQCREAHSLPI